MTADELHTSLLGLRMSEVDIGRVKDAAVKLLEIRGDPETHPDIDRLAVQREISNLLTEYLPQAK